MAVVSNTSPILNLAIIGRLEFLQQQFREVLIPPAVLSELKLNSAFPGTPDVRQALEAGWINVRKLQDDRLARVLALELDVGEAEAIALALELGVAQILLDERDGRARAKAMELQPIGVIGVLLRAKRDGNLDSVETAMQALRRDAGFFISDDLLAIALRDAGER
jgi:predicted nucleic acid-binding protein